MRLAGPNDKSSKWSMATISEASAGEGVKLCDMMQPENDMRGMAKGQGNLSLVKLVILVVAAAYRCSS